MLFDLEVYTEIHSLIIYTYLDACINAERGRISVVCMQYLHCLLVTLFTPSCMLFTVPASPPRNLSVVSTGPNSLSLSWEEPPAININGMLTVYSIEYNIAGETNQFSFDVSSMSRSAELNGLNNFTNYSVSVAANTVVGMGPFAMEIQRTDENGIVYVHTHGEIRIHTLTV